MKTDQIERVFGRGRLKMATGEHVEVFREAVVAGQRRRYTKRFLDTGDADFGQWTEREWRILARLIGHGIRCVPDVVQFDGDAQGGMRRVQTYDAGVTVDQWATLLPVARDDVDHRHVFEDCAHWWALAHHCLAALDEIHALQLVHLDVKADNICIPYGPADFVPQASAALHVSFERLALIDFAFSLVSGERLATPLPIGWQKDYDYQSPRLLRALDAGRAGDVRPTQELDWRCDFYSLAAMLRRYLPDDAWARDAGAIAGWTTSRYDEARALVYRLRDYHDRDLQAARPHRVLMETTGAHLALPDLARSLAHGWTLRRDPHVGGAISLSTPLTRIAAGPVAPTRVTSIAAPAPIIATPVNIAHFDSATVALPAVARNPRLREPSAPRLNPVAQARRPVAASTRRAAIAAALAAFCALAAPGILDHPTDGLDTARVSSPDGAPPVNAAGAPSASGNMAAPPARAAEAAAPRADAAAPQTQAAAARAEAPAPHVEAPAARSEKAPPASGEHSPRVADTGVRARYPVSRIVMGSAADKSTHAVAGGPPASRSARDTERLHANATPVARPTSATRIPAQVASTQTPPPNSREAAAPREAPVIAALAPAAAVPAAEPGPSLSVADTTATPAAPAVAPAAAPPTTPTHSTSTARAPAATGDNAPRRDRWRLALHDVLKLFGPMVQRAAPVDDRAAQSSGRAASPAPDTARQPPAERTQPPQRVNELALASHAEHASETVVTGAAAAPLRPLDSRAPANATVDLRVRDNADDDLGMQARRMLRDSVPRVAAQASADVYRVLWAAAAADSAAEQRSVVDAAYVPWRSERAYPVAVGSDVRARMLHEEAKRAYAAGRDGEALDLLLRALAANPRDPDVAGFLAFLHLRLHPGQPETARQLALHALAFSGARRSLRLDDWHTLAVASALSGRDDDASRSLLVELALSNDAERSCRSALQSYATYGERLRVPVEALMRRVHGQGRDQWAPGCAWPQYRTIARAP